MLRHVDASAFVNRALFCPARSRNSIIPTDNCGKNGMRNSSAIVFRERPFSAVTFARCITATGICHGKLNYLQSSYFSNYRFPLENLHVSMQRKLAIIPLIVLRKEKMNNIKATCD